MVNISRASSSSSSRKISGVTVESVIFCVTGIAAIFALSLLVFAAAPSDNYSIDTRDLSKKDQVASLLLQNAEVGGGGDGGGSGNSHSLFRIKNSKDSTTTCKETSPPRDFKEIGRQAGTAKVLGNFQLESCLQNRERCNRKEAEREKCRTWDYFYDTVYNRWLRDYSKDDTEPFQFLEIGFYHGQGLQAFTDFLPKAEKHGIEISCIEQGPREEGKWPWGNFAEESHLYDSLIESKRLHCGDASEFEFLHDTWTQQMKRPDAPPLKVVVDDGSHVAEQMAASLFFWIPRIEPGGMLIVEGLRPDGQSDMFRSHILPQVMKDLHWCGDPTAKTEDTLCFPTIQPFLEGVHCEMHICVFHRNDKASEDPPREASIVPERAFRDASKCLFGQ
eukprot:scaffold265_cov131-Cylindrotheca_fusiformis.AAC.7